MWKESHYQAIRGKDTWVFQGKRTHIWMEHVWGEKTLMEELTVTLSLNGLERWGWGCLLERNTNEETQGSAGRTPGR